MLKRILLILLLQSSIQASFSQEASGVHFVEKSKNENEYLIKTTIEGLYGVDIANIKYAIEENHLYSPSPNNAFFSNRSEGLIKFYIVGVPATGEVIVELGITLSGKEVYSFPVLFQYSKNEIKKEINLPNLTIDNSVLLTDNLEAGKQKAAAEALLVQKIKDEKAVKLKREEDKKAEVLRLAKLLSEKKEAERIAKENLMLEQVAKQKEGEEALLAKQLKAEKEAELKKEEDKKAEALRLAKLLSEKQEAERIETEKLKVMQELPVTKKSVVIDSLKYTVQLLSLSKFSQIRLNAYCKKHNLNIKNIYTTKVGVFTKVTYGKTSSKQEANQLINKLKTSHQITEAFVTIFNK